MAHLKKLVKSSLPPSTLVLTSVTRKKSSNVYITCQKMISLEK